MSLRSAREGAKGRRRRRGQGRRGAVGGLRPESGDGRRVVGWPGRWGHPPPRVGGIFGVPPRARRGSPRLTWTVVTALTAVSVRVGSGCVDLIGVAPASFLEGKEMLGRSTFSCPARRRVGRLRDRAETRGDELGSAWSTIN